MLFCTAWPLVCVPYYLVDCSFYHTCFIHRFVYKSCVSFKEHRWNCLQKKIIYQEDTTYHVIHIHNMKKYDNVFIITYNNLPRFFREYAKFKRYKRGVWRTYFNANKIFSTDFPISNQLNKNWFLCVCECDKNRKYIAQEKYSI